MVIKNNSSCIFDAQEFYFTFMSLIKWIIAF